MRTLKTLGVAQRNPEKKYLIKKVWETIVGSKLFSPGERIVIGVSGGPDSVGLLLLLYEINQKYHQNWHLIVAHLNHQIRGKSADEDEAFVSQLAKRLNLAVYTKRINVPLVARLKKLSLEEAARIARYHFLQTIARRVRSNTIAVAHTLDDNAETVLMNILRGTGLRGLRGILPTREISSGSNLNLVRPLIQIERSRILEFLKKEKQPYRIDSSNFNHQARRNLIRLKIMPYLKRFQPRIKEHLVQLTRIASEIFSYLDKEAEDWINKKSKRIKNGLSFYLKGLRLMQDGLRNAVFAKTIEIVKGNLKKITTQHYDALNKLIFNSANFKEIHLPDGLLIKKEKQKINFIKINSFNSFKKTLTLLGKGE